MTPTGDQETLANTAAELVRHPAVADAAVVVSNGAVIAYVVPDPDHAPLLHRACALEAAGRLDGLHWHEPADDLLLAQVNRTETDFLYLETFRDNAYFRHGITLSNDAVVIDVGANIGIVTVYVAAHSRGARVVAIEPVAESARALAVNIELHQIDARVLNFALGSVAGEAELTFYPGNTVMSGLHADRNEDREVLRNYLLTGADAEDNRLLDAMVEDRLVVERRVCQVRTLSDVVAEERLDHIDLLKIDVEKSEGEVLAGIDGSTWELIDQIVIEVHDINDRLADILNLLAAHGFEVMSDQDQRLELTPCYNVYGHRSRPDRAAPSPPPQPQWPTRRAFVSALRDHLEQRGPLLPTPDRFVFVATLDGVDAGAPRGGTDVDDVSDGPGALVLAEIWADLFGPSAVHNNADFFDLGGDSLTGVRLLSRIEARLGEDVLAPDSVFTAPRFADLAAEIDARLAERRTF